MHINRMIYMVLFASVLAGPAQAGLYCVEAPGTPPECIYDDARYCRQLADERSGACTVNTANLVLSAAVGADPVCIVYSPTTIQCLYRDFSSCDKAAESNSAACANLSTVQVVRETRSGAINTYSSKP